MDEIQKRLKETSETCIASYEKWATNKKDTAVSETLREAIHELRKVASRLEIELAVSERDEMAQRPMPIPPHRSSMRNPQGYNEDFDSMGNVSDNAPPQGGQNPGRGGGPRRHHGGGHRRHHGGGGREQQS